MTEFVIRSMSTTDWVPAGYGRPEQKSVPYHIYLMKPEKRIGAWWQRSIHEAMRFDSETQAAAYVATMGGQLDSAEIAPIDADARGLPTYWENQRARYTTK